LNKVLVQASPLQLVTAAARHRCSSPPLQLVSAAARSLRGRQGCSGRGGGQEGGGRQGCSGRGGGQDAVLFPAAVLFAAGMSCSHELQRLALE